jgi:Domain of unknown function DUF29
MTCRQEATIIRSMDNPGYNDDLVLWAEHQAEALREAGRTMLNSPIDWENVAEEIEDLGKSQRRDLASRISTILIHLMKLEASPATDPVPGWRETIRGQRAEIERLLEDAPSLRQTVPAIIAHELPGARRRVGASLADYGEQPRVGVVHLAYEEAAVLRDWWPPEPSPK